MTRRELLHALSLLPLLPLAGCRQEATSSQSAPMRQTAAARPESAVPSEQAAPTALRFDEVGAQSGLHFTHSAGPRNSLLPEDMGSGLAWGDYDNDGFSDLYVVNQTGAWGSGKIEGPGNRLFHNNGNGTFTDVTEAAGLELHHFGMGAWWGDYDNDGHLDLFVTGADGCRLYHNEGNGRFRDVTRSSGVFSPHWSSGALWIDFDCDGWLDLYVLHYVDYPVNAASLHFPGADQYGMVVPAALNPRSFRPLPNRLLRNNRDGTFTDVTRQAGVADADGRSLTAVGADFDLDGWPELYVGNDLSMNRFFLNRHDGSFADRSTQTWTSENKGTMGLTVGDYDQDGDLDFFAAHWLSQGDSLYQNLLREQGGQTLAFTDAAEDAGLAYRSLSMVGWGCNFFDYDADGKLDLLVVNGNTLEDPQNHRLLAPQRPFLLHFDGTAYHDVTHALAPGFDRPWNARGLAMADYDNDGDLDVAISCNRGPLLLLRASGAERHNWLQVSLEGKKSNRNGIGARVRVSAGGQHWLQTVGSQGSYLSQHALPLHFGLGPATRVDQIEIVWPGGGSQFITNIPARQHLRLREE